jgi:5-formyltetrahydrofolate cyclo-ligase
MRNADLARKEMMAIRDKTALREEFRKLRREHPAHSDYLYLLDIPEIVDAKVITSYYPLPGEPSLITLNDALIKAGKTVLLPRIVNQKMEFVHYLGAQGDLVQRGKFHEPVGNIFIGEIQVCLVPATAIDQNGIRLGQGGGYYDQFLIGTPAFRIGIIHDREFVKKLPSEWFDQTVEAIATESGFRRI